MSDAEADADADAGAARQVVPFGPLDAAYAETLMKEMYAFEVDRKDKILNSIGVVTPIITVVLGGLGYIVTSIANKIALYLDPRLDVLVLLLMVAMWLVIGLLLNILFKLHLLLAGENYYYLPDAQGLLANLRAFNSINDDTAIEDGMVTAYARQNLLSIYAQCISHNARTNDERLGLRQKLYRSATASVVALVIDWPPLHCTRSDRISSASPDFGSSILVDQHQPKPRPPSEPGQKLQHQMPPAKQPRQLPQPFPSVRILNEAGVQRAAKKR